MASARKKGNGIGHVISRALLTLLLIGVLCACFCGIAFAYYVHAYINPSAQETANELNSGLGLNLNSFIQTLAGAAIASLTALFLVGLTPGQNLDAITIGTLMVLVPGRALTNAMWEIMAGDIISGVNRTAEALLIAAAIALGVVVALTIGQ